MHAKEPTIYCVEIRACLTTVNRWVVDTYRVGRYRRVVLQGETDKARIETEDNQIRSPLPILPSRTELIWKRKTKGKNYEASLL